MKLLKPIIILGIGLFIIYWAQSHSPEAGLGQVISNELSGSYTMSEPWYYISMVVGSVLSVIGVLRTYKSLK